MSLHQELSESEAYRNFINSVNSSITRYDYDKIFSYFMAYCKIKNYDDMLAIGPTKIEGVIRDYIIRLRHERSLSPATISSYIAPITHFYEMNDITIKWKKLNKFKAKYYNVTEDKPYTREQIKALIDAAPLRDKCIILVMCSAGLRRGAIPYLRIRDLTKIDKYGLYKINVYKKEQEQYTTFCTPECAKYIDQYLEWRQHIGEQLKPNSPLFRTKFDVITQINRPRSISAGGLSFMIHELLDDIRVRVPSEINKRSELMQTHGFRKFFKTTCINGGMNPLYSEYVMGHRSGLTKSYFKPSDMELLEGNDKTLGYVSAINDLTINEECRLRKKVDELSKERDEVKNLKEQMAAMQEAQKEILDLLKDPIKLAEAVKGH
ncbi:MAG TPA: tyrosine-type recombinase/integrase [Nitrososphaeraceae archaeon]